MTLLSHDCPCFFSVTEADNWESTAFPQRIEMNFSSLLSRREESNKLLFQNVFKIKNKGRQDNNQQIPLEFLLDANEHVFLIEQYLFSMHYLKQTATKVRDRFFSDKTLAELQNNFLVQLVLLSSIKDFLFKSITEQEFFLVPEHVKRNAGKNKKVLVLDMDQTLVFTRRESKPGHSNYKVVHYDSAKMYVQSRPLLQEFLTAVSEIFDIYVYTAGNKSYADAVLNEIDKKGVIKRRFYRDCCKKENGTFYKDLKHLKKVAKSRAEMILIDDNTVSVGHNYPFAIKIKEFEGDQADKELTAIFKSLLKFYI